MKTHRFAIVLFLGFFIAASLTVMMPQAVAHAQCGLPGQPDCPKKRKTPTSPPPTSTFTATPIPTPTVTSIPVAPVNPPSGGDQTGGLSFGLGPQGMLIIVLIIGVLFIGGLSLARRSQRYRRVRLQQGRLLLDNDVAAVSEDEDDLEADKNGRVKVQFTWDRQGTNDDGSSASSETGQSGGSANNPLPPKNVEIANNPPPSKVQVTHEPGVRDGTADSQSILNDPSKKINRNPPPPKDQA